MITRVSSLSGKGRVVDGLMQRTDQLNKSVEDLRSVVREAFRNEFGALTLDSSDLNVLEQQQARMANLVSQVKTVSPIMALLTKEQTLLNLYQSHVSEWRSDIGVDLHNAWKDLLMRCGLLLAALVILVGAGAIVRRLTDKHVHDANTRKIFIAGEHALLWLMAIILILVSFAFDLSSLATFLGLLAAGLAVGLHDIFLAVGGYLLMVYRYRVRPEERVEICGVLGEVRKIGLIDFELSELDRSTGERTGRVVAFSNSCVFVAPSIPLFRRRGGPPAGLTQA
jgi:small-conductance mechanosensitive channel